MCRVPDIDGENRLFLSWKISNSVARGKSGQPAFARKIEFLEAFQSDLPCPVPFEKILRFARRANHLYKSARPGS